MDISLIIPAFIAGLASFFMPCTFPLVPSFIAFITGGYKSEERNGSIRDEKLHTLVNALTFILGFSTVFVFFGIIAGLIGNHLGQFRVILSRVGGIVIIIFGILLMDVIKIQSLQKSFKISPPKILKPGTPGSSFIVGASIGLGWSPCIGPILGSILLLASTSTTVFQGAILLTFFSIGLGLPFFITAIFGVSILEKLNSKKKLLKYMNIVGGILLILLGIMQLTDRLSLLVGKLYQINTFGLLDYL
jgi:cytochrome c-type biogenesis protein